MTDKLPTTEEMLADLAKVEGLDFFWQILAMAASVAPSVYTKGEAEIIAAMEPRYTVTPAGKAALRGES